MTIYDDITLKLKELETEQRRLGIVTVKLLGEVLPKRVTDMMSIAEIGRAANLLNSMREEVTPVVPLDVKSRAAGE